MGRRLLMENLLLEKATTQFISEESVNPITAGGHVPLKERQGLHGADFALCAAAVGRRPIFRGCLSRVRIWSDFPVAKL
jgi:hypothetical protein